MVGPWEGDGAILRRQPVCGGAGSPAGLEKVPPGAPGGSAGSPASFGVCSGVMPGARGLAKGLGIGSADLACLTPWWTGLDPLLETERTRVPAQHGARGLGSGGGRRGTVPAR